jgi:hypothetical protein
MKQQLLSQRKPQMRTYIYAALAAGSMFALSPAASAAVVSCTGTGSISPGSPTCAQTFGNSAIETYFTFANVGEGLFSSEMTFTVPSAGSLALGFSSSTAGVDFTSVTLNGAAATITTTNGLETGTFTIPTAGLGAQVLQFIGNYTPASSTAVTGIYSGNITFTADLPPVPLPGALVLMGTVLAGGAGFGAMRKRAKKASALQAA